MAKKRPGRAAPKPTQAKRKAAKKSAKRSTVRRPVVSDPDDDVFVMPCSGVAGYTQTLNAADDDDDDVFIPTPGKPVTVQSDWVDDAGAAVRREPSIWEPFQGIKPKAGSKIGWAPALLYAHGLEIRKNRSGFERVVCRYGCDGTTTNVAGVSHHSYTCAYWTREGSRESPF